MALTAKALADFFDLGGEGAEDGTERTAVGREVAAKGRVCPSQRNIEVKERRFPGVGGLTCARVTRYLRAAGRFSR